MRPSSTSSLSNRFTLWRVPPIIAARSDWVYGHAGQPGSEPACIWLCLAREPGEAHRQPAGEIEEMKLLDVPCQTAQLARQSGQQRIAQAGQGVEQLDEDPGGRQARACPTLRVSPTPVAERGASSSNASSAKEVARPQRGDDRLFPFG